MASALGWLDSSERDRRRAMDAISLLSQKETLDELGIGSVRDTIAEVLSPGTSTIQTRARYFFFIPWIYQSLERTSMDAERLAARARRLEVDLIEQLRESPDPSGTIGVEAGASLRRLPSTIYWAGLGRLGFRLFAGSQGQYHQVASRGGLQPVRDDSGDPDASALPGYWNPHIPEAPDGFPAGASFVLTHTEAEFFREQLRSRARESLLQALVELSEVSLLVDFPWEHPGRSDLPFSLQKWLMHAQCYAELMHGAQLLYNLMLSEARKHADWTELYRGGLEEWSGHVQKRRSFCEQWNAEEFWSDLRRVNPRLPIGVETFSRSCMAFAMSSSVSSVSRNAGMRALIENRERQMKGAKARLQNPAQLEMWGGGSGAGRLNYRWGITRNVVRDVRLGLGME